MKRCRFELTTFGSKELFCAEEYLGVGGRLEFFLKYLTSKQLRTAHMQAAKQNHVYIKLHFFWKKYKRRKIQSTMIDWLICTT